MVLIFDPAAEAMVLRELIKHVQDLIAERYQAREEYKIIEIIKCTFEYHEGYHHQMENIQQHSGNTKNRTFLQIRQKDRGKLTSDSAKRPTETLKLQE